MPKAYVTPAADAFDYDRDWKEMATDEGGGQQLNLSNEAQDATLQGWIPWNRQVSAARHFLGYAYPDAAAPWKLHRESPARHPTCPWLRCYQFSTSAVIVKANFDNPNREPYIASVFDPDLFTTYYKWVLATAKYRDFRCSFLYDSDIGDGEEYQRNCHFDFAPKIEALSADGLSQLKFAETGPDGPSLPTVGVPDSGTAFPAPVAELLAKSDFTITWTNLPWDYISSSEFYFYPKKILECLGKVNSDEFMGEFPAGTLLMTGVEGTEFSFPVPSEDVDAPLRGFHVRMMFQFFDPKRGATLPAGRGHLTFPWRKTGLFYLATRDGTTNLDKGMYLRSGYANIFKHVRS